MNKLTNRKFSELNNFMNQNIKNKQIPNRETNLVLYSQMKKYSIRKEGCNLPTETSLVDD